MVGSEADRPQLSGILNVRKRPGMTSHDVVNRIRRIVGMKRVGHAGTLDPAAEGVLLVCLGAATRLSEYLVEGTKRYRALIRFGASSTTDDSEGTITPVDLPPSLTRVEIETALSSFVGAVEQVPPVYAAIKVAGRPLYKLARAGEPTLVAPRLVRIDRIDLVDWARPDVVVDVTCAKGTYIRSLARDLGVALGTGAYLTGLVRTASGEFSLDDSVTLEDVEQVTRSGCLTSLLHPLDAAVSSWPAVVLSDQAARRVTNGEAWQGQPTPGVTRLRAYDRNGQLIALIQREDVARAWRPTKVFPRDVSDGAA